MTELERALVALGNELEFPPTPDFWPRVGERLQRRRWVRPLVFAVALGALALGVALAVPPARSAILRFFHLGSATVQQVATLPPAQNVVGPPGVIVGVPGIVLTTTFVVPAAEVQPLIVRVTEYEPASAVVKV